MARAPPACYAEVRARTPKTRADGRRPGGERAPGAWRLEPASKPSPDRSSDTSRRRAAGWPRFPTGAVRRPAGKPTRASTPAPRIRPLSDDFRRALEEIKLRAPIEDVVRERVPELKKRGALFEACCPFHEERTPSFKVDPRRGTWHCYGACSEGGDQISFIERICGVGFLDALEILAARSGVELPRARRRGPSREEGARAHDVLERAVAFYRERLRGAEGRAALDYLRERGLSANTIEAFGLGWAPAGGRVLVEHARRAGLAHEELEAVGLSRTSDGGRAYDFFRGRLMIPIRDVEGRAVGFGARLLPGQEGPKYVNTAETELFKKGRLVYGLDRAIADVRRRGHLVLVEGYTDVMAAHQVGLSHVAAVLGTATTVEHAALVRRSGARRASLVFDGDEAGRSAAYKALLGLLPLEIELDVVCLPAGQDPCDLLTREGAEPFLERLERASGWFDHACEGLVGLRGGALSGGVDRVLELLGRLPKPVHREALLSELSGRLGLSPESVREQWRLSPAARRAAAVRAAPEVASLPDPGPGAREPARPVDPLLRAAYAGLVTAVLADESLVPAVRPHVARCPDDDLKRILEVVLALYEDEGAVVDPPGVMTALEGHPARRLVVGLAQAAHDDESPKSLLDAELRFLREHELRLREGGLRSRIEALEATGCAPDGAALPETRDELDELQRELFELMRSTARLKRPEDHLVPHPTPR